MPVRRTHSFDRLISQSYPTKRRRVISTIAKLALPFDDFSQYTVRSAVESFFDPDLTLYEDRRVWHPLQELAPAVSYDKPRHRLEIRHRPHPQTASGMAASMLFPSAAVGFQDASKVLICVRRKQRKEVLHALRQTGKGGQKPPKFSEYSSIHC